MYFFILTILSFVGPLLVFFLLLRGLIWRIYFWTFIGWNKIQENILILNKVFQCNNYKS